ncbi:MAG TPA: hypothetical protein VNA69_16305 [Thermoanaerobaculia bacterium]|nr:hypothetical protein [Thermoanaerobaculia bacterium]
MAKKKREEPEDEFQAAFRVVAIATGQTAEPTAPPKKKDARAVQLGRRGGIASAKARAEKIPPERRREIAQAAARARWQKSK